MDRESLRQTYEFYQQQYHKKVNDLRPVVMTIRQIENDLEIPAEDSIIPALPFLEADTATKQPASANGKRPSLRPDEYWTKSHGEAARDYLSRVGHAIPMDDLLEAMKKGGCKIGGIDPKRTLSIALLRNNWKDFERVGDGLIGLRSFYKNKASKPKAKQPSKEKPTVPTRPIKASKPAKAAQSTKAATKATDKVATDKAATTERRKPRPRKPSSQTEPSAVTVALREILKDGELRPGVSVYRAVIEKLGPMKPIAVFGALRNGKEFEQVGKDYRLIK